MFTLMDGTVIDLSAVPPGYGVCYVCGVIPHQDGQGCVHPGVERPF